MGAVDGTHISIAKPFGVYYENFFFHKTWGYNVVVDNQKRLRDVLCGIAWECE
jgi:hypothetical protein